MNKLLREYQTGEKVDSICMLTAISLKHTRDRKPFLRLELGDRSGRVAAVMWEGFDQELVNTPTGAVVRVRGVMDEYNDQCQVKVSGVSVQAAGTYDPSLLLPSSERDPAGMLAELDSIIGEVSHPQLAALLREIFITDMDFRESFSRAPAAKRWHQPYLGGLLEHTLNVHANAMSLAGRYPEVENDLVSAGALVHDIGKTVEYSVDSFFETSTRGRLVGHLVIGVEMLGEWIGRLDGFPEELGWQVKHIILSHHGQYEFGSPVVPRTLEALVVHFADDLDAKVSGVLRIHQREQDDPGEWTSYVRLMEREFYKSSVLGPEGEDRDSPRREKQEPGPKKQERGNEDNPGDELSLFE